MIMPSNLVPDILMELDYSIKIIKFFAHKIFVPLKYPISNSCSRVVNQKAKVQELNFKESSQTPSLSAVTATFHLIACEMLRVS